MLQSEEIRNTSAESDCLHYGMGWSTEDLTKPHIMIQSSYGDSHPGSSHLLELSSHVRDGVLEAGGRPCMFFVTDMCDGIAQGSLGNNYSLLSRDFMAAMIEIQARSTLCDGMVLLASCDKSMPAHIMAAARIARTAIIMPGGCMSAGASFFCCDQMWNFRRLVQREQLTNTEFNEMSMGACPSAGACQQFGTAGTMQAIAEALGLALPGTAVIPVTNNAIVRAARKAGNQVMRLLAEGITTKDILNKKAFENAITVHAAIGGSTNAIVHLLAAANEAGVSITLDEIDRIHRNTPYLTNTLSTGKYPTEFFWYAGGIPALMNEIRELLHADALTVTGKTLGENLDAWERHDRSENNRRYLVNYNLHYRDVIASRERPYSADGGIAILRGNIAPLGAIVKHSAVAPEMMHIRGRVHVFTSEDEAIKKMSKGGINAGEIIAVIGQGPRANGMPELFRLGDIIAMDPLLSRSVAVITDGRYSGCTKGPAIGYICPEAVANGPIGLLQTGDMIEIDIPKRLISLVEGVDKEGQVTKGDLLLEQRRCSSHFRHSKISLGRSGALEIYRHLAQQALCGGNMQVQE
jgi:dihydroxy-acid dehydratase